THLQDVCQPHAADAARVYRSATRSLPGPDCSATGRKSAQNVSRQRTMRMAGAPRAKSVRVDAVRSPRCARAGDRRTGEQVRGVWTTTRCVGFSVMFLQFSQTHISAAKGIVTLA